MTVSIRQTKTQRVKQTVLDPKTLGTIIIALIGTMSVQNSDTVRNTVGLPTVKETEQAPKAIIKGEEEYTQGDLIQLDGSTSVGTHFTWEVYPHTSKKKVDMWVDDSTHKIAFISSHPGTSLITLTASNCNGNNSYTFPVKVVAAKPVPLPPVPVPPTPVPPVPIPPVPTPTSELEELAYSLTTSFPSENKLQASEVAKLINSLLLDSKVTDSNKFASKFATQLRAILKTEQNLVVWRVWYNGIIAKLIQLETNGKFTNFTEYQNAWKSIRKGLLKV